MARRRKNVTAPRSNLIAATKLSDYQIKKIIRYYAYGISAAEASRSMTVSYQSIRNIYSLIRWRMKEVGLYPLPPDFDVFLRSYGKHAPPRSQAHSFIAAGLALRTSVITDYLADHVSELYFWHLRPANWTHERYAERHRIDIIRLIQLSGPINVKLSQEGAGSARSYLEQRRIVFRETGS